MTDLTVAFCNVYVNNQRLRALVRQLAGTNAHVIGLAEGQHIDRLPGYLRLGPPPGITVHAHETPVFLRADVAHKLRAHAFVKATRNTGQGYAHDRWIVEARFMWAGERFSLINGHTNPAGFATTNISPGAVENRRWLTAWRNQVYAAQRSGNAVITTCDWNVGPAYAGHQHDALNLDYAVDPADPPGRDLIDGIGYDPHRLRLTEMQAVKAVGVDGTHKLLIATMEVRQK